MGRKIQPKSDPALFENANLARIKGENRIEHKSRRQ
jgi:hypothetical protein